MSRQVDIEQFAERVERLCDFFLFKISEESGRTGSEDLKIIEDLKLDASDLQFNQGKRVTQTLNGLYNYMNGVPNEHGS